jgi:Domain of unknown function (DUF3303)
MKTLYVIAYRFREGLDEPDLRQLTKKFAEIGNAPGVTAHYSRLDGQGGFVVTEPAEDEAPGYEVTLRYAPWINFEMFPVATIEEAFPVIQRVYG